MSVNWIEPIYDRTYWDVEDVQHNPTMLNPKGCFNYNDLNRIENNTKYVLDYMLNLNIISSPPSLRIKTNWKKSDIPLSSDIKRIIENIKILCELSNPQIKEDLPNLYVSTQITYTLANDMERALNIMHTQPELPPNKYLLTIKNGEIVEYHSDFAYVEEDEVVTIRGIMIEDTEVFIDWSGNTNDLQYVDDIYSMETTFTCQARDITLTANFQNRVARTLTIFGGYIAEEIDDEDGPTSGTYYHGDRINIKSNIADINEKFNNWTGTKEAIENISGIENSSTISLVMPDCNVNLYANFIEAGYHEVTIINGEGSGLYNYGDTVVISPSSSSGTFTNWSGDTNYLKDIYTDTQSFIMLDKNVLLRANFEFEPNYYNIKIYNGLVEALEINEDGSKNKVNKLENVMEGTKITLVPVPPDGKGLDYWSTNIGEQFTENSYIVKSDVEISAYYQTLCNVTLRSNIPNSEDFIEPVLKDRYHRFTTASRAGDYEFVKWKDSDDSEYYDTDINILVTDNMILNTIFKYNPLQYYNIKIINRNDYDEEESYVIKETEQFKVKTNFLTNSSVFVGWYSGNTLLSTDLEYKFYVSSNKTIEAKYRPRHTYTLSLYNATFADETTIKQVLEYNMYDLRIATVPSGKIYTGLDYSNNVFFDNLNRAYLVGGNGTITARFEDKILLQIKGLNNDVITIETYQGTYHNIYPQRYDNYIFKEWSITSGNCTLSSIYKPSATCHMGTSSSIIQAIYEYTPIQYFDVTVENGYAYIGGDWVTFGRVQKDEIVQVKMKPAPRGYKFEKWYTLIGRKSYVQSPYAETTTLKIIEDVKIKAEYYIPDEEPKYIAVITNKNGKIEIYKNEEGYKQDITADEADEGYKFDRWDLDYRFLIKDRHQSENTINTPSQDISLIAIYERQEYVTKYHLFMYSAECLLYIDENDEEVWGTDGEFEAGTQIQIRPTSILEGWRFDGWLGKPSDAEYYIDDTSSENTYISMPDFDCNITATIAQIDKYSIRINDGGTSGEYGENDRVDIYFDKVDDDDIHYNFIRWDGDTNLRLYDDSGNFDTTLAGDIDNPQYVKMPARRVLLSAIYDTLYHLSITNGTITSSQSEYFQENDVITISADTAPQGYRFGYWSGDIENIGNIYSNITTITMRLNPIKLEAIYIEANYANNIGYSSLNLKSYNTIISSDINIISGTLDVGFIITDITGNLYIISNIDNGTIYITKMTKSFIGGNHYE